MSESGEFEMSSDTQQRLHRRYEHLAYRKRPQIAVVAVARELVGFLWAVMRDLPAPEAAA